MRQKEEVVMKVLVAVASRHNATRDIAELIVDELRPPVWKLSCVPPMPYWI
jgi:flavodoxin